MFDWEHPCENCGKKSGEHRASNQACPLGKKHRTLGYCQYYENGQVFEPKKNWKRRAGKWDKLIL